MELVVHRLHFDIAACALVSHLKDGRSIGVDVERGAAEDSAYVEQGSEYLVVLHASRQGHCRGIAGTLLAEVLRVGSVVGELRVKVLGHDASCPVYP